MRTTNLQPVRKAISIVRRIVLILTCLSLLLSSLVLPGCVIVQTGVTNPIPGLTKVAVVPFFNLSQERTVDGRRFALAYFTELQKVPGFQVLPVGVAEQAIFDNQLEMNNPDDVLQLAEILDVDAVVVGAVTDYDPYYPPRIGMKVSWYSPYPWEFYPGLPTDPGEHNRWREIYEQEEEKQKLQRRLKHRWDQDDCEECEESVFPELASFTSNRQVIRGQSADEARVSANQSRVLQTQQTEQQGEDSSVFSPSTPLSQMLRSPRDAKRTASKSNGKNNSEKDAPGLLPGNLLAPFKGKNKDSQDRPTSQANPLFSSPPDEEDLEDELEEGKPQPLKLPPGAQAALKFNPRKPLMSYTRIFDGSNADLVARLRDYLEISGDKRSGGWEGYLQRSEDFIRFTSHLMVVEMLTLHGGEAQRRFIFKLRKNR